MVTCSFLHKAQNSTLHSKHWEIYYSMEKRMMILHTEILKFISLSSELVSLSLGMNWQCLLKVNIEFKPRQDCRNQVYRSRNLIWNIFQGKC